MRVAVIGTGYVGLVTGVVLAELGNNVICVDNDPRKVDMLNVVSNPEFLREGSAIYDTLNPDRIVIGAKRREAAVKLVELYAPLEKPMILTDLNSAELIKYASNAFLASKISFINAMSRVCEASGANVADVAKGMG